MAAPAIIWRNPNAAPRRRLFNPARYDETSTLYIVVRSGAGTESQWEGMPNLEVIKGGAAARSATHVQRGSHSRA